MTINSVSGNSPANGDGKQKEVEKREEKPVVSIYHKLDTEGTGGQKGSDCIITAKEFGIDKLLNKVEEKLLDLKSKANGVTYNVLNAMFKMVNALRTTFKYDLSEAGLKSVDAEALSRQQDLQNLDDITSKLKKDEEEGTELFKKTQFGLLDKPENQEIDADHNTKAKELTKKDENEKINKRHEKDLNKIFSTLVEQRKDVDSIEKLEKQKIPFEKGEYFIRKIKEKPIFVGRETKGETRTETGSHVRIPDIMQLTIEYEYKGADGKTEIGIFVAETKDIPKDYTTRGQDDGKSIDLKQEEGDLSDIRW